MRIGGPVSDEGATFPSCSRIHRLRLHWHRRDLRLGDNPALSIEDGPVLGCFVIDPALIEQSGNPRVAFLRDALTTLQDTYRNHDGGFVVRRGDPVEEIPAIAREIESQSVSWEADYTGFSRRRDQSVREKLEPHGIDIHEIDGSLLHAPGSITTSQGTIYQVFRYFWEKWIDREKSAPTQLPQTLASTTISRKDIDEFDERFGKHCEATIPRAGPAAAMDRLQTFCSGPIERYASNRDRPAADATSRLSVDLSFGTIGIRTVWERTRKAEEAASTEAAQESVREFQRQLAWREFYTHALWDRPDTITSTVREFERPIEWRNDPAEVKAWREGQTGFPIVDAGMRQLSEEAWMHNRVRMIVASFLTKDLLADWRLGYRWFRDTLVDHDTANDVGGWQWAASTGTDAQPYFRIFNPMTQGERHDPDAVYIRRYVPQLADVPRAMIHQWDELDSAKRRDIAPEYPEPIIDHAERRADALAMFERARG